MESTVANNPKNPFKITVIVLSVVAVLLAALLLWIWIDRSALIDDLTIEKDQLTQESWNSRKK